MRLCAAEDGDDTRQSGLHAGAQVQWCDREPDGIDPDHRSHPCRQVAHSAAADAGQRTVTMAGPYFNDNIGRAGCGIAQIQLQGHELGLLDRHWLVRWDAGIRLLRFMVCYPTSRQIRMSQ